MKKRTTLITTIIAAAALATASLVFAEPGGHGPRGHGHGFGIFGHLEHIKSELGLTDNQTAQIKVIFAELREQNDDYRDSLHGGFRDVAQSLLKNPNDLAGAQRLLDEQLAAEKALRANMLTATSKALNVLTAEQRTKLSELIAEHAERRERRRR